MHENRDEDLRPKSLDEYIGQGDLRCNLKVYIDAARKRKEPLDHLLFFGPPGLGKTTLAAVIAFEMDSNIRITSGPSIEKPGDLAIILATINEGDILFIDEIHRMPKIVEETIYTVMEDFKLNMIINNGDGASRNINIKLPRFTLIGATTRPGSLSLPLRSRFGILEQLNYYDIDDLVKIVLRTSQILKSSMTENAALEVAKRSRGTPRTANRLFKRVRDFSQFYKANTINTEITISAMKRLGIDDLGLDELDNRYLKVIIDRYNCGPVGIEAIAAALGEEVVTIRDMTEPYLLQMGLINRTSKGREVTKVGLLHLGIKTIP